MNTSEINECDKLTKINRKCGICGNDHNYLNCTVLSIIDKIVDKTIPTKARLSLPDQFDIIKLAEETAHTVVAKTLIKSGTEFGPFIAKRNLTLNPENNFPIKIFLENAYELSEYYLDTSDENECCWMMFINAAAFVEEQNLICYQENEEIYFAAIKDIQIDEKLKVWYSSFYASRMHKNLLTFKHSFDLDYENESKPKESIDMDKLVENQQKITPRKTWSCKFCYKVLPGITSFANHLSTHYKQKQRKTCTICQQTFLYLKDFKNHIKIVHNEINKLQIPFEKKDFIEKIPSEVESVDRNERNSCSIGGPLLVVHNDTNSNSNSSSNNTDNSNNLLQTLQQQFTLSHNMDLVDDVPVCELENFNLNVSDDNILINQNDDNDDNDDDTVMKDLNYKNVEEEEEQSEIICDICLKTFHTFKSITLHLNFHMGKYFCNSCKKIFARSENLNTHKCNINFKYKCDECHKLFYQKKYLMQHISIVHEKKFSCKKCKKWFFSANELNNHLCSKCDQFEKRLKYQCDKCQKVFLHKNYLKTHSKTHHHHQSSNHIKNDSYICSICSKIFRDKRIRDRHVATVHEKKKIYECRICDKLFNRSDILKCHLANIHNLGIKEKLKCLDCGKTFKSQKHLSIHTVIHNNGSGFKCFCGSMFKQKSNLTRHAKQFHKTTAASTTTTQIDKQLSYECPICHNKVKLKRSLTRHIRTKHPEKFKSICLLEMSRRKKKMENGNAVRTTGDRNEEWFNEDDLLADLQATIENMDFDMENLFTNTDTVDRILKESSDAIGNLFGDEYISSNPSLLLPSSSSISGTSSIGNNSNKEEVCLSMPDLDGLDGHDIKLGKNTVILENEQSVVNSADIVVYFLNDKK